MNLPPSPAAVPAFSLSKFSSLVRRAGLAAAGLIVAASGPGLRAADSFLVGDWETVEAGGMNLVYQGAPPSLTNESSGIYPGSPCNWASTGQIATLAAGTTGWAGTGIMYFLWSNRWDNTATGTNRRANPIAPGIERSVPLPWEADEPYAVGEVVYEAYGTGTHWWRCVEATDVDGDATFAPGTTWVQIDEGCESVYAPECRIEYSTLANAIAANVVQTRWLAGRPDHADDGSGYLDALSYDSATLAAAYTHADLETNADTIFTSRAALASSGYAVVRDIVYLPPQRLVDTWTDYAPGTAWAEGDLIRDQGNLLPNNFTHYTSAEYTDSSTGLTPASTTKTIAGGYCELTGNNRAVRHKLLLPADSGATYELCVTGKIVTAVPYDATYNPSSLKARVRLQVFGLDSSGAETATHVEANFTSFNATGTTFTLRQKFAASSGTDTLAWPAGATHLRFSVNTNGGFGTIATSASVSIQSMLVTTPGAVPSYWRCVDAHTSPASSGTAFATFAADRAPPTTAFKEQKVGVELDHEVSDRRDPSDLTALLTELHDTLSAEGYVFHVYTNSLDDYLDTISKISTATKNGFSEGNMDDVLAHCDVLTTVIFGSNQRGNDAAGLMAATYNRMAYVNGTYNGTPRTHFAAGKIGFALELPDRGAASSRPIRGMTLETDGTIKIYSVAGNGASADGYVKIGGLTGALGTAFNGQVFRVKTGGTDFKIDAMVSSVSSTTGAVTTTSLPTLSTYAGGGYFETSGLSVADFTAARDTYFTGKGVPNFNLWRSGAAQKQAAPDAAIEITGVTVTTDTPHKVILKTGTAITWDRVYVSGMTGDWAILNGTSYGVDRGAADECPPPASDYSGTEFLLDGYDGDLFTPGDYTISSGNGDVANAMDRNVNAKISALADLP